MNNIVSTRLSCTVLGLQSLRSVVWVQEPREVCARRALARPLDPRAPNAQALVERELEWAELVHANEFMTGHIRGKFV